MRPTRLELQGFASFREPTVIDFTDVDLFVLSGPTGAGKSSVIDALVFALYGSVPRYDNKNLVAPVISQGQLEARVQLDLSVEGDDYRATRVVRRTKAGATTKEARLELITPSDTQVIAGAADELTAKVEDLLGLTFDHFVRTVVLPQGAFQDFMHAKPKERQDLLVELLDLDIYRRIASMARDRAKVHDAEVTAFQRQLSGQLAEATPEARDASAARVAALADLLDRVDEREPKLERIREEGADAKASLKAAEADLALIDGIAVPEGIAALSERLGSAGRALAEAEDALSRAATVRETAQERADGLPDPATLTALADDLGRQPALDTAVDDATADLERAEERAARAVRDREEADAAVAAARLALDEARRRDLAHTLSEGLAAGDDCPVCARPLDEVPSHGRGDHVEVARRTLAGAEEARDTATASLREAERAVAHAESAIATAVDRRDAHRQRVTAQVQTHGLTLDADRIRGRAAEVTELQAALSRARREERAARQHRDDAKRAVEALDEERTVAWRRLEEARLRVGTLSPPAVASEDLAAEWERFRAFTVDARPQLARAVEDARAAVDHATERWKAMRAEQWALVDDAGLERTTTQPRDVVVEAKSREGSRLESLDKALEELERVRSELATRQQQAEVARELGKQLSAKRFEQWLLNRALDLLVGGASSILRDLSRQAYSLALDDGNTFQVIDHRNADETRPARTLSGGETFLASLSLALALSEQVADLAVEGSARLDALFIDEGFGTLDADTLDTVATAIEELGSRGRMVGLVTHVQDLAERLPVRYEVTKTASTSAITRVDA